MIRRIIFPLVGSGVFAGRPRLGFVFYEWEVKTDAIKKYASVLVCSDVNTSTKSRKCRAQTNEVNMLKNKLLLSALSFTLLAGVAAGCGEDDEAASDSTEMSDTTSDANMDKAVTEKDIVDTAVAAGDFTILVEAVQAAGLVETLKGTGPFTVFAPTDQAFADALEALNVTKEALLSDTVKLATILKYHVVSGKTLAADVVGLDGQEVATVAGPSIKIAVDGDMVMVNDATVTKTDIETSNGVIHVIDKVLLPPS